MVTASVKATVDEVLESQPGRSNGRSERTTAVLKQDRTSLILGRCIRHIGGTFARRHASKLWIAKTKSYKINSFLILLHDIKKELKKNLQFDNRCKK